MISFAHPIAFTARKKIGRLNAGLMWQLRTAVVAISTFVVIDRGD